MTNREIQTTEDGSKTLYISALNEGYHSSHGALREARHVFIENGLNRLDLKEINILELGFGTGLNALVTIDELLKKTGTYSIRYFGLEKYPVNSRELAELNYPSLFNDDNFRDFSARMHTAEWNVSAEILPGFHLTKFETDFFELGTLDIPPVDLVYFDCFGARVQPKLWEDELLKMVADKMRTGALFTTYASKGSLRRSLKNLGFQVQKMPGPPGKREMINAIKI